MSYPKFLLLGSVAVLLLTGCNKTAPIATPLNDGPHARITLRDGGFITGRILESTPTQVVMAGDDNISHTVPTTQIRALEYEDATQIARSAPMQQQAKIQRAPARRPVQTEAPAQHAEHYHPAAAAVQSKTFLIPAGTAVPVRVEETIDSSRAAEGQTFAAELTSDVLDGNNDVVIPRGSNAQVIIRSASRGNRFNGQSDLVLDLETISVDGRRYQVSTRDIIEKGKQGVGANKRTGLFTGGGAAFGAIIGAIAGGGKGAAIGAASGAGAGVATEMITKGGSIRVPVESILTFQLDQALRIQ